MSQTKNPSGIAFMNFFMGGSGARAGYHYDALWTADGRPFPMSAVNIDTEPSDAPYATHKILLAMTAARIAEVCANPSLYGPTVTSIIKKYPALLDPEDLGNGARTTRLLTQLMFIVFKDDIRAKLAAAIRDLFKQDGVTTIIPVFVSSSGGGTGSAMQILLALALRDPNFRSGLLEGLRDDALRTPISFVVEPFAHALKHHEAQANMVLANAYAFRLESVALESRRALKYVLHLGFSNAEGDVLDSPDEVTRVLGSAVYLFQRDWLAIKAQFVNNLDSFLPFRRYMGDDDLLSPGPSRNGDYLMHSI
jgi:hypothetical protein